MFKIFAASCTALIICLLLPNSYQIEWKDLTFTPPESNEEVAYSTHTTLEPTPRWVHLIMDHFKRNLPRHCVETLTDNDTVLNKELMEIRANMTKDPSWALRRITELVNLKGTTPPWTDADLKNFTFPDMGINDYDVSKSKGVDLNFSVETDYDKLKAKYDPYDLVNNKSINWDEPTFDDQMFEEFLKRRLEINEAGDRLIAYNESDYSQEEGDMDDSDVQDQFADVSAKYKEWLKEKKKEDEEAQKEFRKWSRSGGNYSTTTVFNPVIEIKKPLPSRSFRKGGRDMVFDLSCMTLDPLSLEQIEKNLDFDYWFKYGKNRTKSTTMPTTTMMTFTTEPTSAETTTTPELTTTYSPNMNKESSVSFENTDNTDASAGRKSVDERNSESEIEENKSIYNSELANMTSKEQRDRLDKFQNNFLAYDQEMGILANERKKRSIDKDDNLRQINKYLINNRINMANMYLNTNDIRKDKMKVLGNIPKLSKSEKRRKEMDLENELNKFIQPNIQNNHKHKRIMLRKFIKRAAPVEEKQDKKYSSKEWLNKENFNKHPDHPVFVLSDEDLNNGKYKTYNTNFINDKLHEYVDDMFDELRLNVDTSEEEKRLDSIYYRKYLEKRTTNFYKYLRKVITEGNKRDLASFTYPPNFDFDQASLRDPEKYPELKKIQQEYERVHAKSIEARKTFLKNVKDKKAVQKQWREEARKDLEQMSDDK